MNVNDLRSSRRYNARPTRRHSRSLRLRGRSVGIGLRRHPARRRRRRHRRFSICAARTGSVLTRHRPHRRPAGAARRRRDRHSAPATSSSAATAATSSKAAAATTSSTATRWLNVRISVTGQHADGTGAGDRQRQQHEAIWCRYMLAGDINPGQLGRARDPACGRGFDFDTAMFSGPRANYTIVIDDDGTPLITRRSSSR